MGTLGVRRDGACKRAPTSCEVMTTKSIGAVAVGVLVIVGVTTLVDVVLHVLHVYPAMDQPLDHALSVLATSYRIVIGIAGAWLTARLAPNQPMKHAMILGYIGTVLGFVGLLVTWNKGLGPRWYAAAHVVLAIPECWIGGKIHEMRSRQREATGA